MARIDKGLDHKAGPSGVSPTGSLGALSAQVAEPLTVMVHHPKLSLGYGMLEVTFERSELGDDYLKGLAVLKAATMIAREFCIDIGSDLSRAGGVTEEQLRGSPDYGRSETFSPLEKLMVR